MIYIKIKLNQIKHFKLSKQAYLAISLVFKNKKQNRNCN